MLQWYCDRLDPNIGRSIGHDGGAFDDNPWSLKKEEGGRHTPFHNKMAGIKSKEDVYVWKIKSKEDVYVWKIKSKEDVYVWKIKSKEDVYVWKVRGKGAIVSPPQISVPGGQLSSKHTKTGHVTLMK